MTTRRELTQSSQRGVTWRLGALAVSLFILLASQAAATTSSGDTSQTIDPLVVSVESDIGGCEEAVVGWSLVADLCGDIDGCSLRLITDKTWNTARPALSFAASGQADRWCVAVNFHSRSCNVNGDDDQDVIVQEDALSDGSCVFTDDGISFDGKHHYRLQACADDLMVVRCTLRIDD